MGLSNSDIEAIAVAWRANMEAVQKGLLAHNAFAWDLFPNQHDAGCGAGPAVTNTSCHAVLSSNCGASDAEPASPPLRDQALYYGLTKGDLSAPTVAARLPDLEQDLANFMLLRGDFGWLGYGFLGCGATRNCKIVIRSRFVCCPSR